MKVGAICKRCGHHRPGINAQMLCASCEHFAVPETATGDALQALVESFGKPRQEVNEPFRRGKRERSNTPVRIDFARYVYAMRTVSPPHTPSEPGETEFITVQAYWDDPVPPLRRRTHNPEEDLENSRLMRAGERARVIQADSIFCTRCNGDGGATGNCPKCGGNGFEP